MVGKLVGSEPKLTDLTATNGKVDTIIDFMGWPIKGGGSAFSVAVYG